MRGLSVARVRETAGQENSVTGNAVSPDHANARRSILVQKSTAFLRRFLPIASPLLVMLRNCVLLLSNCGNSPMDKLYSGCLNSNEDMNDKMSTIQAILLEFFLNFQI